MVRRPGRLALGAAAALVAVALAPAAQAEDFLSALFGAFGRPQAPATPLPYASEGNSPDVSEDLQHPRTNYAYSGGSQAYCVRTCDGRYFPIAATGNQSKAASCNSFCPPATPRWSMAAISIVPSPRAESPIPSCRTRSAIAMNWSRAAPAMARIPPVSHRSKSRTTRRCARATSWQGAAD